MPGRILIVDDHEVVRQGIRTILKARPQWELVGEAVNGKDAIEKAQVTNQYWLTELSGAQADPRRLDFVRQLVPGTERVTAADVQRSAETFLQDAKAWKLEVKAQGAS